MPIDRYCSDCCQLSNETSWSDYYHARLCMDCYNIRCEGADKPVTPDREPVAQAVNYILSALDIIAGMALKADSYDEVAAEEVALGRIISRAELILGFLDTHKPAKMRMIRGFRDL